MLDMYDGMVNSPQTALAESINETQTTITVVDGTKLPSAPNLAVIGQGEDAETILYTAKNGNTLSGVTRGFQGTAKSWSASTPVARLFTEYDWRSIKENYLTHVDDNATHRVGSGYYIAKTSRGDQLPAWADIPDKPTSFSPSAHKSTHAIGGVDALTPADIGAATAADLSAHLADVAPHSGYVAQLGANNQVVNLFKALNQQIDTRGVELTYDANGNLITVTEKDDATVIKTTSLSYNANSDLTTVTEQVSGKTVITTFTYDASGNLVSVSRSVA